MSKRRNLEEEPEGFDAEDSHVSTLYKFFKLFLICLTSSSLSLFTITQMYCNLISVQVSAVKILPIDDIIKIMMKLDNYEEVYQAVQSIRKMLSREKSPPIDKIIETNLLPILAKLLLCTDK